MISLAQFIGMGGKAAIGSIVHFQPFWLGLCWEACVLTVGCENTTSIGKKAGRVAWVFEEHYLSLLHNVGGKKHLAKASYQKDQGKQFGISKAEK